MWIREMFQGFCMAMADSVPGVSGGTIAFLMGFYEKFIGSVSDLISRDRARRQEAVIFLIRLGIGWCIGMGIAVTILASVFTTGIYQVSSLFLGFILASIVILFLTQKQYFRRQPLHLLWMAAGAGLVLGITAASRHAMNGAFDLASISPLQGVYLFAAAAVAICAMVLPGISGSTLLLIFGLYLPVITAVKDLLQGNRAVLPALGLFAGGAVCGILLCARGIRWLLHRFPAAMMHGIVGMMIGSLYSVVQGPLSLKEPQPAMSLSTFHVLFFAIGAALVFLLEKYRMAAEKRETGNC